MKKKELLNKILNPELTNQDKRKAAYIIDRSMQWQINQYKFENTISKTDIKYCKMLVKEMKETCLNEPYLAEFFDIENLTNEFYKD